MFILTRNPLSKSIILNQSKSLKFESKFHLAVNNLNSLEPLKKISNELPVKTSKTEKVFINPLKHEDFFELDNLVSMEKLYKARCHYGHHAGLRCPWMSEYVFGTRINTDIIDLDKTVIHLKKALNFAAHVAFRKGIILFITRYPQHIPIVERTALEANEYSHCRLWENGVFTDSTRKFGSVIRLPDLCIFLHCNDKLNETHGAVNEAAKMLIPTVAICDTDIDPSLITYPIPGNDDSMTSVQLYCQLFVKAILKAKKKREELEKEGVVIEFEPAN